MAFDPFVNRYERNRDEETERVMGEEGTDARIRKEEKRFQRQTKIAVLVYVVLEAVILAIFIYKISQNREGG
jgi:hypothetical protein